MSRFQNISIRDTSYITDELYGSSVFHVTDPHALIQAAGYLKYIHSLENGEAIFFRGQTRLYNGLVPSLFRGCGSRRARYRRIKKMNEKISLISSSNKSFSKFNAMFHEPLLQHYGFRTTWVDLVDNIWVALWFACHQSITTGKAGEYMHFEVRKPNKFKNYVYIVLVGTEFVNIKPFMPGFVKGCRTEYVDLRIGVPSIFLRPHTQHGVLFRMRGDSKGWRKLDYGSQIRGVIRANLEDALEWLGSGSLLNVHSLFPPPTYDEGYKYLLSTNLVQDDTVGGITHIGA
ncbi:MAG: FRG domain-containing protein [Pseudomonadota bacterium]|nr:FRG domain-containing protein [Pseudomonadota bacterium]